MAVFELSNEEVAVVKEILNMAVKAYGVEVAEPVLVLTRKFSNPLPVVNDNGQKVEKKKEKGRKVK